jgi:hypothetical protein
MIKVPDLKEILQKNPSVSAKELQDIDNLTQELRRLGLKPRGYRLAMPHERRQAKSGCVDVPDPRSVHLSESRGP